MKRGNNKIPCVFYLYLHTKIAGRSINGRISIKEAVSYLHEWRIPKEIRIAMIKEMETMELLKRIDRSCMEVKKPTIDLENINKIYEMVGLVSLEN